MEAATCVRSAGRCVAASAACCGPGAASLGGEWLCVAQVYPLHGGGKALGSGVGWVRGRGCRGLTSGRSFLVSPSCVPWWPLVGWPWRVFAACCIHGGTTSACCRVAVEAAVGCGGVACVGVVHGVCGGPSCIVLGGSSWRSVAAVRGGRPWAKRLLGWCGTCGVGMARGRGMHVSASNATLGFLSLGVPAVSALRFLRSFPLRPSLSNLF